LEGTRQPSKEYRARILVKLTDDILPSPVMSEAELQAHLTEVLHPGDGESPIVAVMIDDPRTIKRRY
jgi:hypothetical protein